MKELLLVIQCLVSLAVSVTFADEPPEQAASGKKPLITVSKEITHVTGPLMEDGRVDYVAAYDEYAKRGVTVENNAGVLIVQALGPHIVPEEAQAEFFAKLGIEPLPAEGKYLKSLRQFFAVPDSVDMTDLQESAQERAAGPWKRADDPALYQWIVTNEEPLRLVQQASFRSTFYIPTYLDAASMDEAMPRVVSMVLTGVQELRDIARILKLRAMLRLGEGDLRGAREDLMTIHRLARLTGQSPMLVTKLVSCALEGLACWAEFPIAHHGRFTSAEALAIRAELERLPPVANMVNAMDIGERYSFLDATQSVAYAGTGTLGYLGEEVTGAAAFFKKLPTGAAINFDIAMRMGNEMFDRLVACLEEPDTEKRAEMTRQIEGELSRYGETMHDPKSLVLSALGGRLRDELGERAGQVLLSLLLPAITSADRAQRRTNFHTDLAALAYALAAYRADHQHYPESLKQLTPKYIERLPIDPVTEKPPHFELRQGGYILQSDQLTVRVPEFRL